MRRIPRTEIVDRDEWLVNYVRGKNVLHVGCTDHPITASRIAEGRMLHGKLESSAKSVVGLDYDREGIESLRALMPDHEFVCHNAEQLADCEELRGRQFDVVLAADVVEHLSNVGLFLGGVSKLLTPDGALVITTPNAFSIKRMAAMVLLRREQVHPDHTAYFSQVTLQRALDRQDFDQMDWFMFQWCNPTPRNAFANAAVMPVVRATGGRLCDELVVVAVSRPPREVRSRP